jgi:hypothetical protein
MRLRKAQLDILLTWIAAGKATDEINELASAFRPRFKVTKQQVDYYRKSRGLALEEIKETTESVAMQTGLALRDERIALLKKMAEKVIGDLLPEKDDENRRWLDMQKTVANEPFEYQTFNRGQFEELRNILDDIAKEVGERRPDIQVNNTYNFDLEAWKKNRNARLKEVEEIEAD